MVAGMTTSGAGSSLIFAGRGPFTLQSNGVSFGSWLPTIQAPGGSLTLLDALNSSRISLSFGTFDDGGFTVTAPHFWDGAGSGVKQLNANSTWILNGDDVSIGRVFGFTGANGTINAGANWVVKFTSTSANTKTFMGGGKTYSALWFATTTGAGQVTGSNTFSQLRIDSGTTVNFTAGTTSTATTWTMDSATIGSTTAASHTLAKAGGARVVARNASISRSTATPSTTFYAPGGTDGGNNSGWNFVEPFNPAWNKNANRLIGSGAQA